MMEPSQPSEIVLTALPRNDFVRALHHPWLFAGLSALSALVGSYYTVTLRWWVGLPIALWLLSALMCWRLVILWILRRAAPSARGAVFDIAVWKQHVVRGRRAVLLPLVLYGVMEFVREGGARDVFIFDVSLHRSNVQHTWKTSSSYSFSVQNGERMALRDLPLSCESNGDAQHGDDVKRAFFAEIKCSNVPTMDRSVRVTFETDQRDVWCYQPLYKHAEVHYTANARVASSWQHPNGGTGGGAGGVTVTGTLTQTTYGVMSCRAFNEALGALTARLVVDQLNGFLRVN